MRYLLRLRLRCTYWFQYLGTYATGIAHPHYPWLRAAYLDWGIFLLRSHIEVARLQMWEALGGPFG